MRRMSGPRSIQDKRLRCVYPFSGEHQVILVGSSSATLAMQRCEVQRFRCQKRWPCVKLPEPVFSLHPQPLRSAVSLKAMV